MTHVYNNLDGMTLLLCIMPEWCQDVTANVWLSGEQSSEATKTVDDFLSTHSSWLTDQLQHINDHFNNKFVFCFFCYSELLIIVLLLCSCHSFRDDEYMYSTRILNFTYSLTSHLRQDFSKGNDVKWNNLKHRFIESSSQLKKKTT